MVTSLGLINNKFVYLANILKLNNLGWLSSLNRYITTAL